MSIWYEKHPVSVERKKELRKQGYKIIDIRFAPPDYRDEKEDLINQAVELGIGAKSTLARWSVEKLQRSIDDNLSK